MKKNNNSITKNYLYNTIYQALIILTPIITTPYLSRVLGTNKLGIFGYTLSIATYFVLFGSVGVSLYGQRTIAYSQENKTEYSKKFYEIFVLKTICMLISIFIFYFTFVHSNGNYHIYYKILILELIGNLLDISWFFQGLEEFKKIVPRNFIIKLISIICIFLFVKTSKDLAVYILIYTLALVIGNLSIWLYLPKFLIKVNIKSLNILKHLKPTISLFIPQIAIQVYTVLDKTMIGALTKNMDEVGIYEQSTKIIKILLTLITSLGTVMIPKISSLYASNNSIEIRARLKKSFHFVWALALPICLGLIGVSNLFIPWFLGDDFLGAIPVVQIGSLLFLAIGLNNVTGMQYLIPVGKQKEFTYSVILGALINFIGNTFLIPKLGSIGAIIFSVVAETTILIAQMVMIRSEIKIKDIFHNSKHCFFAGIIMFSGVFPLSLFLESNIVNTIVVVAIGVTIYCLIMVIFKDELFIQTIRKMLNISKKILKIFKRQIKKITPKIFLKYINKKRFIKNELNKLNRGNYKFSKKIHLINSNGSYSKQFLKLFNTLKIEYNNEYYFYNIDYTRRIFTDKHVISNMPIDYTLCMKSLNFIEDYSSNFNESKLIVSAIKQYLNKIVEYLKTNKNERNLVLMEYFTNMIESDCGSFDEALQRILFYNQLLWQTNHRLVGLGRLDVLLYSYYENDLKNKKITKESALDMIKQFLIALNKDYCFKSNILLGDTGQLIILSGLNKDKNCICNDLTFLFIQAVKELQLPDPKILLRVSEKTSRNLFSEALSCIKTGIGSPLFANDDVIIKCLQSAGFSKSDSYNYVTSACWEPLILGKSFDQNNLTNIVFLEPLNMVMDENIEEIDSFKKLMDLYESKLGKYIKSIIDYTNKIKFQEDPLMSIFTEDCIKNNKDISSGGAIYNNYGLLSVSLSNTVNSLLTIKEKVFKEHKISLNDFNKKRLNNSLEKISLKNKFGSDNKEVIDLTNKIMIMTSKYLLNYKNKLGGNYKFGLSSPNYISSSLNSLASFDGRKANAPYSVHISSEEPLAYTELTQFAGKLDYSKNKYNGNVVDFFISPSFIENNYEKFVDFLMLSLKSGYFEMQMNVVSSDILIAAKKDPTKFPNLIVRVWGFSAYFKDLPEEYKDLLVRRALENEGKRI